jgi:Protein of unknown function, DUF481
MPRLNVTDCLLRRLRPWTCCVALLIACMPHGACRAAPKTDVVVLTNGDRLTGEVKEMQQGQLRFGTDAAGTISIEWEYVASLQSDQMLQIELASGLRYLGQARPATTDGNLHVELENKSDRQKLPLVQIVRIFPIDQGGIIARLDGYVTAGYDYTKANDLQQFTFTGGLTHRNERRLLEFDGSTTSISQDEQEDTNRFDITGTSRLFLRNRRFWQAVAGFERNDELGLELRSAIGGAYGLYAVQSTRQELALFAGLAVTREDFATRKSIESLEGVLGVGYSLFRFNPLEANVDASLVVLPSLTESGRVRSEAKLRSRYEIISDLFFEISLYGSYDSDAVIQTDSKSDYGVTTSLGYSF